MSHVNISWFRGTSSLSATPAQKSMGAVESRTTPLWLICEHIAATRTSTTSRKWVHTRVDGLRCLTEWKNQHIQRALPKSGKPGAPAYFGSDFVVIVVDAHNGLQLGNNYTGLKHKTPTGKTVFEEYHAFFDELSYFAQVVYGYSDCSERFQMDPTLDEEARTCALAAKGFGLIPYSLKDFGRQ